MQEHEIEVIIAGEPNKKNCAFLLCSYLKRGKQIIDSFAVLLAKPSGINQAVGEREAYFYDLYRTSKERPPINLLPLRRIKSINKNRINFSFAILPFSFDDVLADAPQRVGN